MFSSQHHAFHIPHTITSMYCYLQAWARICVALRVPEAETEMVFCPACTCTGQACCLWHGAALCMWQGNCWPPAPGEHTHTYIHTHIHTLTHVHTHTHTPTHSYSYSHSHTHKFVLTHTHTHSHTHTPIHTHTHTHTYSPHTHPHTHTHTGSLCTPQPSCRAVQSTPTSIPCASLLVPSQPLLPGRCEEPVHVKSQSHAPTLTSKDPLWTQKKRKKKAKRDIYSA